MALFFLVKIAMVIQGLLCFHMNSRIYELKHCIEFVDDLKCRLMWDSSVCCEYVLLPLVKKEGALACGRAE